MLRNELLDKRLGENSVFQSTRIPLIELSTIPISCSTDTCQGIIQLPIIWMERSQHSMKCPGTRNQELKQLFD